jgi:hypothetical protein
MTYENESKKKVTVINKYIFVKSVHTQFLVLLREPSVKIIKNNTKTLNLLIF